MLAVVLGFAGLAGCGGPATAGVEPTTAASTSATPDAGAIAALARLDAWFGRAGSANMAVSTVLTSRPADPIVTMMQLAGTTDVPQASAQLAGGRQQISGGPNTEIDAVASGGQFYSTVPPRADAGGQGENSTMLWSKTALSTIRGLGSKHSIWWLALNALTKVHLDGTGTIGKATATEYTGTVDLSTVPGIPASLLQEPFFKGTGSTQLSVDLYTDVDTGALVQLTYRMGLKVSIDAEPAGQSVGGFQVDLDNFGSPTPLTPPVVVPAEKNIISSGNDDLSLLLFF